jgi:mono/diheme cytochrome c family protein
MLWSLPPAALLLSSIVLDRLLLGGAGGALLALQRRWRPRVARAMGHLSLLLPPAVLLSWSPWSGLSGAAWILAATAIVVGALAALLAYKEARLSLRRGVLSWAGGLLVASCFCLALGQGVAQGSRIAAQLKVQEERAREEQQQNNRDPQALFEQNCAACHGVEKRLVGPPLTEIARIYAKNPAGIVSWARAPGRKRADSAPMPSMAHVKEEQLSRIADYMLSTGAAQP